MDRIINFEPIKGIYKSGSASFYMWRAKIPGGWLLTLPPDAAKSSPTFIPDPDHSWDGSSLP